jgi:hypothetical protein
MTIEQFLTVAGFVLAAGIAVFVAVFIGHQLMRLVRAIERVAAVITTILARLIRLALIGGLAIGIVAGGIWWAMQPTAEASPLTTTTPLPTQEVEIPTTTSRAGLPTMSIEAAQRYGVGFAFINDADNTVCVLQNQEGQDWLVANCD